MKEKNCYFYIWMGCLKLTYQQNEPLLKCAWNKNEPEKSVQWFLTIDPAAEVSRKFSPYAYCFDNPIRYIDVDGLIPIDEIVKGGERGSKFGPRARNGNTFHNGLDIKTGGKTGLNVRAAAAGIVEIVKWNGDKPESARSGYGLYVVINHGNGYYSYYGHLEPGGIKVENRQKVTNGQLIALSGNTGDSDGPHMHLGFKGPDGKFIDPEPIDDLQEFIDNGYQTKEEVLNDDQPTEIEGATVTAKSQQTKDHEARCAESQEYMRRWMDSYIDPNRLYPGDARYTCSYWETYDMVRNWGNPTK